MKRRFWTIEEKAELTRRYPSEKSEIIAASLGRTLSQVYNQAFALGLKKSAEYLASPAACRTNGKQGTGTRFTKGQAAWNKGMKGLQMGGKETQFKVGTVPPNHKPVGSMRVSVDGYIEIKVQEGLNGYRLLHRENWKKEHGDYPAKGMALVFKDGNKQNCAIENLECITRKELMQRNTVHNLPKELAELVQLRGALNRQINKRTEK